MSSLFDIDSYLESLDDLPENLRTKCSTMHNLGVKNKGIINDIDLASDEYLRKIKELSPEKKRIEKEKIQKMFNLSKKYADEKVEIAIETYELVDQHIRELDIALAKLEENIRLRETESELSEEEIPEEEVKIESKKKKKTKKKFVKNQNSAKSSKYDSQKKNADVENKKQTSKHNSSFTTKSEKSEENIDLIQKLKKSKENSKPKPEKDFKKKTTNSESEEDMKKPTKYEEEVKKRSSSVDNDKKKLKKSEENDNLVNQVSPEHLHMAVDPNEPTYCFCRQVSFGDMIGCDNDDCSIEWFHFECLGITVLPKGKWYCPDCLPSFKKKPTIKRFAH